MYDTIVTAPGSLGDVNPLIVTAQGLQAKGRRVVVATAERYLPLIERAGLGARMLECEKNFAKVVNNPDLWHPRKGMKLVLGAVGQERMQEHYAWIASQYQPGKTLLVSHVLDFAGRVFRDAHPSVPFCSVLPEPVMLRSLTAPPQLTDLGWEKRLPKFLLKMFYRISDSMVDRVLAPSVNQLRHSVGLPSISRLFDKWWVSPDKTLGLFPEWFAVPKVDWPAGFECTGFPLADAGDLLPESAEKLVSDALAPLNGQRPIVFAPGSAHAHAKQFLSAGAQACQRLNLPGVLLSSVADQFPDPLPKHVITAAYLPFRQLMPHALAIVHHGGIGTTSQTISAGLPQIVCPMAFDQFDNGGIVQRAGCGRILPMTRVNADRLTRALSEVLHNQSVLDQAKLRQQQVHQEWASPEKLADLVLQIAT